MGVMTLVERYVPPHTLLGRMTSILAAMSVALPGQLGREVALCLTLLGIALLTLHRSGQFWVHATQMLGLAIGAIAFFDLVRHVYGSADLYELTHTALLILTGVGLFLLSVSVLFARPQIGFAAILSQSSTLGTVARLLIPLAVAIPLVMGWFQLYGSRADWYDIKRGASLFVTLNVVCFIGIVVVAILRANLASSNLQQTYQKLEQSEDRFQLMVGSVDGGRDSDCRFRKHSLRRLVTSSRSRAKSATGPQ